MEIKAMEFMIFSLGIFASVLALFTFIYLLLSTLKLIGMI